MSAWAWIVGTSVLALAAYSAAATLLARRTARRHIRKVAAIVSVVVLITILLPIYLDPAFLWSAETSTMVRDVAGWAVAACLVVVPGVAVTTRLATHFAATASPPARSWALTWAAGVAVLFPSLLFAFGAAVMITGEGP